MRLLSEYINGIARFSMLPEHLSLTPKEASKEILKKGVLEKEESCKILNLFLEGYLEKAITALREEMKIEPE